MQPLQHTPPAVQMPPVHSASALIVFEHVPPPQVSVVHSFPSSQSPFDVHSTQLPETHMSEQVAHVPPPTPQAEVVVPASQVLPLMHPSQHAPLRHIPAAPPLVVHEPVRLGLVQVPLEQTSFVQGFPSSHCALAVHSTHEPLAHMSVAPEHDMHDAPPSPHALTVLPG